MPLGGHLIRYVVIDEVRTFQDSKRDKIVLLQLMEFEDLRREVRIGYYIIGKKPKMRGKWVWGQYAAFIPPLIFKKVFTQASKQGWFRASRGRRKSKVSA